MRMLENCVLFMQYMEILDPIVRSCRCAMGCNASHHTVHVVIEMDWSAWSL